MDYMELRLNSSWGPFENAWQLLNASDDDVATWAKQDPTAHHLGWKTGWPFYQVQAVTQMLEALRGAWKVVARGALETDDPSEEQVLAFDKLGGAMRHYVDRLRLPFLIAGGKVTIQQSGNQYITIDHHGKVEKYGTGLIDKDTAVGSMIEWLFWHVLTDASISNVYICEYCGKIGPAKQKNKRFCNATCRKRAQRKRMDTNST